MGRAENGHGDALVSATLLTARTPFDQTPESATAWLAAEAIVDAGTRLDEDHHVVFDLFSAQAVERLISVLLAPRIRANSAVIGLTEALAGRRLAVAVNVHSAEALTLTLQDSAAHGTVAAFAELLGAPDISAGLDLTQPGHLSILADRLAWLTTGIAGSVVTAEATPECRHEPDHVTLALTPAQARALTHRLDRVTTTGSADPGRDADSALDTLNPASPKGSR